MKIDIKKLINTSLCVGDVKLALALNKTLETPLSDEELNNEIAASISICRDLREDCYKVFVSTLDSWDELCGDLVGHSGTTSDYFVPHGKLGDYHCLDLFIPMHDFVEEDAIEDMANTILIKLAFVEDKIRKWIASRPEIGISKSLEVFQLTAEIGISLDLENSISLVKYFED